MKITDIVTHVLVQPDFDVTAALQRRRNRQEKHEDQQEDRDIEHPGDRIVQQKAIDDLNHDRRHDHENKRAGGRREYAVDRARERFELVEPIPAVLRRALVSRVVPPGWP